MPGTDPRVDDYIRDAAPFARPILTHIRAVVHAACPAVEEDMKWNVPHFMYKGMLCGMAAFTRHCALTFWKGALIGGGFGRITEVADVPARELARMVKEAAKLNDAGVKAPKRAAAASRGPLTVPAALMTRLRTNKKALAAFERFSPSHRREYIEWINEAKTEATRTRRAATAVEWLAEGRSRNWKYERRA